MRKWILSSLSTIIQAILITSLMIGTALGATTSVTVSTTTHIYKGRTRPGSLVGMSDGCKFLQVVEFG